ncbi:tetratricopeptide repeat protein [Calycomorphotria hydatis]|uniref:Tetratricopeptide repeat protein n=1 Tax=Calycomorphotria hydatis TaxID=2528027 RepID=A0A517T9L9_9PLAN|nr:hypothetical protein [Calycomorphotria hydatis]QDT65074.1 Tetratricopeptide repeat protein [Calycomorphotria hydatis]
MIQNCELPVEISRAFHAGEYMEVVNSSAAFLLQEPENARVWSLKGMSHHAVGHWVEARNCLEQASLIAPMHPFEKYCLADCYHRLGKFQWAVEYCRELAEDDTLEIGLALKVAATLSILTTPQESLVLCRKLSKRDPDHAQLIYDMALYAARAGSPRCYVRSMLRKAIELEPQNVMYRVGTASVFWKWDEPREAYQVLDSLSEEQLQTVCCEHCLGRVAEIFARHHEWRKARACRDRIQFLIAANISSCC